ncbi:FAD-dependent oxidoreductase [Gordonia sp. (in: high G+C Gram-positive bacteria)]|uniref:FAD-dependent oxidoreductase n=1 Tax=Gordonia sp. (in: high G+C Gram-positive bacteria) TaxID=84139 RepID=UPI003F9DA938
MPHVITQACCGDASCVYACPVNCIHPTPDEPDFGIAEMLYVDPATCVDCGACVSACPVGAIVPGHRLPDASERFADVNAAHYGHVQDGVARFPVPHDKRLPLAPITKPRAVRGGPDVLDIAIVGSGPSAMYAADELLKQPRVRVTVYERLDVPFGLSRFGVAPDHTSTRSVMNLFDDVARHPNITILLNTEIGRDISLGDLRSRHHAVVWAGGAPTDKTLAIPGVQLSGVQSATSLVGWYNGHPDFIDAGPDLSCERVVVIGNGNVALDVARILTADVDELAKTDISREALAALRSSSVREVVVVGRRGPAHAAFTLPELIGLADGHARVQVRPEDVEGISADDIDDSTVAAKIALLHEISMNEFSQGPTPAEPFIRLAFGRTPVEVVGDGEATGVRFVRTGTEVEETIDAGLVLTSIGYRGVAVPGLPFDDATGTIANVAGRVVDGDTTVPGMYVTGWIKRGPSGFIGTNKTDSGETIANLLADVEAGVLSAVS